MKKTSIVYLFLVLIVAISCNSKAPTTTANNTTTQLDSNGNAEAEVIKDSSLTMPSSEAQNDLCKYEWTLMSTSVADNIETALGDKKATIKFNIDGTFNSKMCNSLNGKYVTNDTSSVIKLTDIAKTRMLCDGVIMKIENSFKSGDYEYDITKGYLTLSIGETYFTFNRKTTTNENKMAN